MRLLCTCQAREGLLELLRGVLGLGHLLAKRVQGGSHIRLEGVGIRFEGNQQFFYRHSLLPFWGWIMRPIAPVLLGQHHEIVFLVMQ